MKLFFTDLDGTLLNSQGKISQKTKLTLDNWIKAGNKLIFCSGRPLNSILEVKEFGELDYPGILIVANNGSLIYDCDTSTVLQKIEIPYEHVSHILDVARNLGIHCQAYTDTHIVCEDFNEHIEFYISRIHLPYIITKDVVKELPTPPLKLLAIDINSYDNLETLRQELLPWSKGKIEMLYSNQKLLEIIHCDSGKGNAVRTICKMFDVPIEDSIAAGDMNNDFSMLEAAGTSIAMKNATPLLKEMADIVTDEDNNNDGLAYVLEQFI